MDKIDIVTGFEGALISIVITLQDYSTQMFSYLHEGLSCKTDKAHLVGELHGKDIVAQMFEDTSVIKAMYSNCVDIIQKSMGI